MSDISFGEFLKGWTLSKFVKVELLKSEIIILVDILLFCCDKLNPIPKKIINTRDKIVRDGVKFS